MGDDALMVSLYHALSSEFEVRALSGNPDDTYRNYKISSLPRRDSKSIDSGIAECDALVFPGGSVFQDATSRGSVLYYSGLIKKAKAAKKKVILLSQGIGPLTKWPSRDWAVKALSMADVIVVRDPASLQALKDLKVRTNIKVGADLSFLMPSSVSAEDADNFNVGGMRSVGVAPRPVGKGFDTAGVFGDLCRLLYQAGYMPVLVPMDHAEDMPLIEEISKRHGGRIPDLRKAVTPMQVQQRLARMDTVIAMRLHAGILSAGVGVPPLMVSYDPKVAAFARMLEVGNALALDGLTAPRLMDQFSSFMKDHERNIKLVERKRKELVELAEKNIQALHEAIGVFASSANL